MAQGCRERQHKNTDSVVAQSFSARAGPGIIGA
jgi:hypothetical protein